MYLNQRNEWNIMKLRNFVWMFKSKGIELNEM